MLSLDEMLFRLLVAVVLGAVIGFERELVGKEAGVRTDILVAAGAVLFTMASMVLPYLIALPGLGEEHLARIIESNGGPLRIVSNVVVGIGFLGAGIIFRHGLEIKGVTTAASVWFVAAVGMMVGIGLIEFAAISAVGVTGLLFILRKIDFWRIIGKKKRQQEFMEDE